MGHLDETLVASRTYYPQIRSGLLNTSSDGNGLPYFYMYVSFLNWPVLPFTEKSGSIDVVDVKVLINIPEIEPKNLWPDVGNFRYHS